jgi:error-prone DNA polymerase
LKPSAGAFTHLHVRSGFSYGFGTATPEEFVEVATGMGIGTLALTDRDGLYGVPRFLEAARIAGLSPIVGAEIGVKHEGCGGHLVLLAEGMEGYRSLCRLITAYRCSSEDRRRPVCPLGTVLEHSRGLICLTGAVPFGLLPRLVLSGRGERAGEMLGALRDAFGPANVYVELTDDGTAGSRKRVGRVESLAERHGVSVLATNEVAYPVPEDHRLHEALVAATSLSPLPGPDYRPTDRLYLRPPEEMTQIFRERPAALRNTAEVAIRCAGAVDLSGVVHLPGALLPTGISAEGELLRLASSGVKRRYGRPGREVWTRLHRELRCIEKLGFASYFLLAYEAVGISRSSGVPVTGRGSAANSLVSYCLGLTSPEPFANRLLFERFMHEGRKDPPDIDLDLDSEGRDGVRDELMRRYERFGSAVAATASTMSLRGAVRVAARALGYSPRETDEFSRYVPSRIRDRDALVFPIDTWEKALAEPAMRGHPFQDRGRYGLLLDLSSRLHGRLLQAGTHNGGTVFGNERRHLSEIVPLEPSGKEGLLRCQYDKDDLEYVGLPKLDLLGLKMHTALRKAGELASARLEKKVDPYDLPPGDGETYRLIRSGRNAGMFQLESPGQMNLSTRLKPRRFSDLVAQISLFRPGPMRGNLVTPYVKRRNGEAEYSVPLPELEEVLRPTYGVMVFQEQALEISHRVAGFTLAEGDGIRRAMTRERGPDAMRDLGDHFVERAVARGVPEGKARDVFSWMEGFSVYGFSAAHGASFAELAYASAYMRRHYPAEFFCGLLDSQPMGFYSPRVLLNEARRAGITILPPDVHRSGRGFTVEDGGTALRVGLDYCKGLSNRAIRSILSERRRPFASVADLYRRTAVERDSLEMLVRGGYLDVLAEYAGDRSRPLAETARLPKKRKNAQPEIPLPHPGSWWEARERRRIEHLPLADTSRERMEWEALSLNVSRHPLLPYRAALRELGAVSSERARRLPHGSVVRVAGLIECLQSPPTKSGHPVYFLVIEDELGLLQTTLFRSAYERCGELLHREGAFLLEGRVEHTSSRGFAFLVQSAQSLGHLLADVPVPRVSPSPGAFLRVGRRSRRAG